MSDMLNGVIGYLKRNFGLISDDETKTGATEGGIETSNSTDATATANSSKGKGKSRDSTSIIPENNQSEVTWDIQLCVTGKSGNNSELNNKFRSKSGETVKYQHGRPNILPILENKKVVGIISIGDVLKIMIKEQKELIDHLQKFITS